MNGYIKPSKLNSDWWVVSAPGQFPLYAAHMANMILHKCLQTKLKLANRMPPTTDHTNEVLTTTTLTCAAPWTCHRSPYNIITYIVIPTLGGTTL